MQAGEAVAEIGLYRMGRVKRRHEGDDAHDQKDVRGKRPDEAKPGKNSKHQVADGDRPSDERGGFVKIIDRAFIHGKTAFEHGYGMQDGGDEEQEIIYAVILAKSLSPQENRVSRTQAVTDHGEQKKMPVCEPRHGIRLIQKMERASGNSALI